MQLYHTHRVKEREREREREREGDWTRGRKRETDRDETRDSLETLRTDAGFEDGVGDLMFLLKQGVDVLLDVSGQVAPQGVRPL